ncbi:hypothetical protein LPJ75_001607 [Coemansia sp. RSA 2598]|nr:hypothetical protein LPJ75_001607 [Coemansia sp. RSA 2598]
MTGIDNKDGGSAAMDTTESHAQQRQSYLQHLGLFDMDISGDTMGAANATAAATTDGGNFPFPLADQSSIFNFHTPSGLGFDSLYADVGGSFDFPSTARLTEDTAASGAGAGAGSLAMDIALLNSVAKSADPISYAAASSMIYDQSIAAASPTAGSFPAFTAGEPQALLQPTGSLMTASSQQTVPGAAALATGQTSLQQQQQQQQQGTDGLMAARVRAARARVLNNILYNMSLGGIQGPDGFYNGAIATPLANVDEAPGASSYSSLNRFLADVATSTALGIPVAGNPAADLSGMPLSLSGTAADFGGYPMISPMSPNSPIYASADAAARGCTDPASSASAVGAQSNPAPSRVDQACKMCRRRKVRCDGRRPSCAFCLSKKFDCVYEPVAPGGRKRGRRSKTSDSGSVLSSNLGSVSAADQPAGWRRDMRGGQHLPSIISGSSDHNAFNRDSRSAAGMSYSDAGYEREVRRKHDKHRRLSTYSRAMDEIAGSPAESEIESDESSSSEGPADNGGYLRALSNRQIALPANVSSGFSLQDILDSRADIELAEGVAAAALASIASDPRNRAANAGKSTLAPEDGAADSGSTNEAKQEESTAAGLDNGTGAEASVGASADAEAGKKSKSKSKSSDSAEKPAMSIAERHMQLYFRFFHPQHPVLHRHTFEKAVREGTVNKVLWHAVQAIAARYGPPPKSSPQPGDDDADKTTADSLTDRPRSDSSAGTGQGKDTGHRAQPYEYGKRYARLVRAMLPEATRTPSIEVIQALYLLSEHQFGMGDWLEGSTYWGTAVRMFNQLQLHMIDEAFQFPAYTSHLGLHESAISPLTCKQSPAHYATEMRKPTLNNESWIRRELERRMRWALFESERMHTLAGGTPPLITLEAGWVHMPCSDAIWEMPNPRRAAEYERLLLHMGRYYVDTGGSLRIDMATSPTAPPSQAASRVQSRQVLHDDDTSDGSAKTGKTGAGGGSGAPVSSSDPIQQQQQQQQRRKTVHHTTSAPNRVASMLVSVRRRKNRIHLKAHTAIVIGQMTRARLALFRLFFPCRWPSQLMSSSLFGAGHDEHIDLGGGGGAPGPVVLSWDERFRRMRITIADIEAKLMQWRVYLESMFPLREHEEGSGRTDEENQAIHRERVEYANYRFMLAALIMQNRSTVLQLQACLARRERKIRCAGMEPEMDETAKQTLANHILPNQPSERAMRALRAYGQECWTIIVRQACEIEDLLESHWQVRPHRNPDLRVLIKPDWHASNAIKAKINAEANLRRFPEAPNTKQRVVGDDVKIFFSHETPPYPLLVTNHKLLEAVVKSANSKQKQAGAELTLASSMNSNIHIETNANARDMARHMMEGAADGVRPRGQASAHAGSGKKKSGGRRRPRIHFNSAGEVDFESGEDADDDADDSETAMDPFRMQLAGTSYFVFLAAKTMIMYLHHAKMSAYILARRKNTGSSDSGDGILPSSSVSVDNDAAARSEQEADVDMEADAGAGAGTGAGAGAGAGGDPGADAMLVPDFLEDLSPAPQLRTLSDIRQMQDRLEVVMTALRASQKYWMSVDYYVLCARKLRNMAVYGPWRTEDPVSTDISAELANEPWSPHGQMRLEESISGNMAFSG